MIAITRNGRPIYLRQMTTTMAFVNRIPTYFVILPWLINLDIENKNIRVVLQYYYSIALTTRS